MEFRTRTLDLLTEVIVDERERFGVPVTVHHARMLAAAELAASLPKLRTQFVAGEKHSCVAGEDNRHSRARVRHALLLAHHAIGDRRAR
jgi:hypothetical protein